MVIMLSTGHWSYTQVFSLCTSVMSLSWGAARSFASILCIILVHSFRSYVPDSETERQIRPRPKAVNCAPAHLAVDACGDCGQHLPPCPDRRPHRRLHLSCPSSLLCPPIFSAEIFLQKGQIVIERNLLKFSFVADQV